MIRFTYQHLLELVDGDHEFIVRLVEEGLIEDEVLHAVSDSKLSASSAPSQPDESGRTICWYATCYCEG